MRLTNVLDRIISELATIQDAVVQGCFKSAPSPRPPVLPARMHEVRVACHSRVSLHAQTKHEDKLSSSSSEQMYQRAPG